MDRSSPDRQNRVPLAVRGAAGYWPRRTVVPQPSLVICHSVATGRRRCSAKTALRAAGTDTGPKAVPERTVTVRVLGPALLRRQIGYPTMH
jgi:hypothetical protein